MFKDFKGFALGNFAVDGLFKEFLVSPCLKYWFDWFLWLGSVGVHCFFLDFLHSAALLSFFPRNANE